jgi:diacylglycerol kinase
MRTAVSGIVQAVLLDFSAQDELLVWLAFLVLVAWYESPCHFVLVLNVTALMMIAEIFNTVIEELCEYGQPDYDEYIGRIKDMAAAAAWISVTIWLGMLVFSGYELLIRGP